MMQPTVGNLVGYLYMTILTSCWDLHGNDQTVLGVDHGLYRPLMETRAIQGYMYIYTHMPMDDPLVLEARRYSRSAL